MSLGLLVLFEEHGSIFPIAETFGGLQREKKTDKRINDKQNMYKFSTMTLIYMYYDHDTVLIS